MRLILIIALFFSCSTGYAAGKDTMSDVYKGVLPCGDCKGVKTSLTLRHMKYADEGIFVLQETHNTGKPDEAIETMGVWTVLRGDAVNKNAVVIELYNIKTNDALKHYLKQKDGSIKMLDNELRAIKAKGNYILKKT